MCPSTAILFPGQGSQTAAMRATAERAAELGLRAMELPVTGGFHSPMMASAVPEFEAALNDIEVAVTAVPVISAVTLAKRTLRDVELVHA